MAYLDPTVFGRPTTDNYSIVAAQGFKRTGLLQGRPRHQFTDPYAKAVVQMEFDWSMSQFIAWQDFWATETRHGEDPFEVDVQFTTMASLTGQPAALVHATGPYTAEIMPDLRVRMLLQVEITEAVTPVVDTCTILWGGHPSALASNDISAGTPASPAADIIVPCEGVLP